MNISSPSVKILVSDRTIDFNKEEIEALVYYSSGDVLISAQIDGRREEINLINMNMTNIRLFLANWITIKNDDEKIMSLFVVLKNIKELSSTNNVVNLSKTVADSDLGMISFTSYEEFATTLLNDPDVDNSNLLDNGLISIDRSKLKTFLSNKIEGAAAKSWSDSKLIQKFQDEAKAFIKVNVPAMADYISTNFFVFKSATTFYIINKLGV